MRALLVAAVLACGASCDTFDSLDRDASALWGARGAIAPHDASALDQNTLAFQVVRARAAATLLRPRTKTKLISTKWHIDLRFDERGDVYERFETTREVELGADRRVGAVVDVRYPERREPTWTLFDIQGIGPVRRQDATTRFAGTALAVVEYEVPTVVVAEGDRPTVVGSRVVLSNKSPESRLRHPDRAFFYDWTDEFRASPGWRQFRITVGRQRSASRAPRVTVATEHVHGERPCTEDSVGWTCVFEERTASTVSVLIDPRRAVDEEEPR